MEFTNNPWVTGIGGGIISSLIVFFVTKYLFSKKENKEYLQKVKTANNEILYSIRPLVIEKRLPTTEIISAIQSSIAKKYGVKQNDLYNELSLYDDLVFEIMANSFLSSEQKLEFCSLLNQLKSNKSEKENVKIVYIQDRNKESSKYISMLLAISSFTMVLTTTLFITKEMESYKFNFFENNFSLILIATFIPIFTIVSTSLYGILYKKHIKSDKTRTRLKNNVNEEANIPDF